MQAFRPDFQHYVSLRHVAVFLLVLVSLPGQALTLQGEEVDIAGRYDLSLVVAAGNSDPETFIPVTVLRGSRPGPTLLVVAGVHGFEFTSVLGAERLANQIQPEDLAGTLILVRVAHVSAFEGRVPYVNPYDRKNLNRSFPGSAIGTQTERIAHVLSTELIAQSDFVIDAHSGDGAEWLESFVGVYGGPLASDSDKALAVARAMGLPNIVRYSMNTQKQIDSGRSLNRQAVAAAVPTLLVEIGENGKRETADVDALISAVKATLVILEMLPGGPPDIDREPRYFEGTTSVSVAHSGLWHPLHRKGRDVVKGERLGVVHDYAGNVAEVVEAPVAGFALYGLAGPPVRAGDSVMSIARPVDELR